jgi:hypothetical protein
MRCALGDMAIVIKSVTGSNLGKIVTIDKYIGYYEAGVYSAGSNGGTLELPVTDHYWWISSSSSLGIIDGVHKEAYGPDTWLQPLPKPAESNTECVDIPTDMIYDPV